MRQRLPPLKSLEGFDAAAQLGSFAAAADALGLSQSAISHQIRLLELALGQPLFRRVHRQVVLTDAGRDFHRTVRNMLQGLRNGVDRLTPYRKPNSVILYCDQAFSEAWLTPRLGSLRDAAPAVDLWLDSRGTRVDLDRTEVDIFVTQDEPDEENGAQHLMALHFRPYASPQLAQRIAGEATAASLAEQRLLHVEGKVDWSAWLAKWDELPTGKCDWLAAGPTFSDVSTMMKVAALGLGIGLVPDLFAAPMVAAGALVPIGARVWTDAAAYRMIVNNDPQNDEYVIPVCDWLERSCRGDDASGI